MFRDVERTFEISKENQYTKITVKNNQIIKVLVARSGKIYLIFSNGHWQYYDSKDKIQPVDPRIMYVIVSVLGNAKLVWTCIYHFSYYF